MKKQMVASVVLALVSTTLVGCFSNSEQEQFAAVDYSGVYEVFTNGRCKLSPINRNAKNMTLEIAKVDSGRLYTVTIPSFEGTSIPSTSLPSVLGKGNINFDPKTTSADGEELTVSATLELIPKQEHLIMTQFTLQRVTNQGEESREMVSWYIDKIQDPTIIKEQLTGLCVKKVEN